jgi:hypothetical protein
MLKPDLKLLHDLLCIILVEVIANARVDLFSPSMILSLHRMDPVSSQLCFALMKTSQWRQMSSNFYGEATLPYLGMKTEQKYSELTVFVFYIMNRFLT